jgi:hypothetical protein
VKVRQGTGPACSNSYGMLEFYIVCSTRVGDKEVKEVA